MKHTETSTVQKKDMKNTDSSGWDVFLCVCFFFFAMGALDSLLLGFFFHSTFLELGVVKEMWQTRGRMTRGLAGRGGGDADAGSDGISLCKNASIFGH
jgi:hypothetical protein